MARGSLCPKFIAVVMLGSVLAPLPRAEASIRDAATVLAPDPPGVFGVLNDLIMPVGIVKAYITGDAITAEVEGNPVNNFQVDAEQFGITVDLNLQHYSKPNPKIKFKAIKTLKAGTASSRTNFTTVPQGASLTSFSFGKMSSRNLCTQQFSAIRAAANKTGFCVVNWSYKKPGSRTISKKTAIRIIR